MKTLIFAALCFGGLLAAASAEAQVLRPLGPEGGDVMSLGQDRENPRNLYLGTADGHIFGSNDGGEHWELLGRTGPRPDSVVTAILVDPRNARVIYASTWAREPGAGGGVFRSADGGRTWSSAGLVGQDVRALVIAQSSSNTTPAATSNAAADPAHDDTLIAGTLDGVFRSRDSGNTWKRISPEGDPELRNLDSLAVDPANGDVIYAGTFHLPWKTTDGGLNWTSIHTGMIDDSDVMSILVDGAIEGRIYASACSGIYRSDSGGAIWQKVQGIPYTARRTVEILQDPTRPEIVFAATTEGLWKTTDAGSTWQRITPADWSVTAMVLRAGAPDRVVIGVEQHGVLASDDGGANFHEANGGFIHHEIWGAVADATHPGHFLVALANVTDFLLTTDDAGRTWHTMGQEPAPGTLRGIYSSPDGWWAALGTGGLLHYDETKPAWLRTGNIAVSVAPKPPRRGSASGLAAGAKPELRVVPPRSGAPFDEYVTDMAFAATKWYAATEEGLYGSTDYGATWSAVHIGALVKLGIQSVRVSQDGKSLWIASLVSIAHSADGGATWKWIDLPRTLGVFGVIERLEVSENHAVDPSDATPILLVETDAGLFISRDAGTTWGAPGHGLPETPVRDLATAGPTFLAAMDLGGLYVSRDSGLTWERLEGGMAEGYFSSVFAGPALPGESPDAVTGLAFYAASATEGLYAIEIGPVPALEPLGDTKH
ncbi:MAG: hypothetical protein WBF06_10005 [Candidatus Acidiferrales bacterium]